MDCSWSPSVDFEDLKRSFDSSSVDSFQFKWEQLCEKLPAIDTETETYSMGKGCGLITSVCNALGTGDIHLFDALGQAYEPIHTAEGVVFCQALSDDSIIVLLSDLRCRHYQGGKCVAKKKFSEFPNATIERVVFNYRGNAAVLLTDGRLLHFQFQSRGSKFTLTLVGQVEANVKQMEMMYDSASQLRVFLVDEAGSLLIVGEDQPEKYSVKFEEKVVLVARSETCSCLAILLESDTLIVCDSFLTYEIYRTCVADCYFSNPQKMVWIGDTVPVIAYDSGCVIGTEGESHQFWVFEIGKAPIIFGDIDCAVVLTDTGSYRLVEVADVVTKVLYNEASDGYKLCMAFSNRLVQPPMQALRRIKLAKACDEIGKVVQYMRTSDFNRSVHTEKTILESCKYQMFMIDAMVFGAQFCAAVNPEYIIKKTTIMNMLFFIAKIPITWRQIDDIGFAALIRRLSSRGHHFLAVRVCDVIGLSTAGVSRDYVEYTIDRIREDLACKTMLLSESYSDIHYAVGYAIRANRMELARMLCEARSDIPNRAMLFAQIGDWTRAFETVTETGNMDELHGLLLLVASLRSRNVQTSLLSNVIAENEMAVRYLARNPEMVGEDMMASVIERISDKSPFADVKARFALQTKKKATISPELDKLQRGLNKLAGVLKDPSVAVMTRNEALRKVISEENQEALRVFVETAEIPRDVVDAHIFQVFADKGWPRFIDHAVGKGVANVELAIQIALARKRDDVAQTILARIDERAAEDIRRRIDAREFGLVNAPSYANLFSHGSLINKVALGH